MENCNGKKVRFCYDNWCAIESLYHMMGLADSTQDIELKVERLINPDRTGHTAQLSNILPTHLIAKVRAVPIPISDMEDTFCLEFLKFQTGSIGGFGNWIFCLS